MKKIFMTMLLAIMATTINAQVTMNVRVGGGFGTIYNAYSYGYHYLDDSKVIASLAFQANIPFSKGSSYTFSPSLFLIGNPNSDYFKYSRGLLVPLQVGKKILIATNTLFFPKLGATLGSQNHGFRIGPSLALAIEAGHFVVSLDAYISLKEGEEIDYDYYKGYYHNYYSPYAASLTLGYKF